MAETAKRFYETYMFTDNGQHWSIISVPTKYISAVPVSHHPSNMPSEDLRKAVDRLIKSLRFKRVWARSDLAATLKIEVWPTLTVDFPRQLLTEPVVLMEHSPAAGISVKALAEALGPGGGWISLASYLGSAEAAFILVPGTLVVMSLAAGIGNGLRKGVQDWICRMFETLPPNRAKRAKRGTSQRTRGKKAGEVPQVQKGSHRLTVSGGKVSIGVELKRELRELRASAEANRPANVSGRRRGPSPLPPIDVDLIMGRKKPTKRPASGGARGKRKGEK